MEFNQILVFTTLIILAFFFVNHICKCKEGFDKCPPGKIKLYGSCKECYGGTKQTNYNDGPNICEKCPGGLYSMPGSTECVKPLDQHQNLKDFELKGRYTCNNGYKSVWENGKFRCCKLGEDCNTSSGNVQATCATGTYEVSNGECRTCPVGQYQDEMNQQTCKVCPAGTYQDFKGQSHCKLCPVGTYNKKPGSDICLPCRPGSYQDEEGKPSCKSCPAGKYQDEWGENSCKTCKENWDSNKNSAACTLKAGKCPVQGGEIGGGEISSCKKVDYLREIGFTEANCSDFYVKVGSYAHMCMNNIDGKCIRSSNSCTLDTECNSNGIKIGEQCICSGNSYDFTNNKILKNSLGYHPNITYYTGNRCQYNCTEEQDWGPLSIPGKNDADIGCPCGKGSPACSKGTSCSGKTRTIEPGRICATPED